MLFFITELQLFAFVAGFATFWLVWAIWCSWNDSWIDYLHQHGIWVDSYDEEDDSSGKPTHPVTVLASQATILEFGFMPYNPANFLIVERFQKEWMKKRGLRPSHLARELPLSVVCYFAPTPSQVAAVAARKTMLRMRKAAGLPGVAA